MLASFMITTYLQPTMLDAFSFTSMGQKEHLCFYISCKILDIPLGCISIGHMPTPELGTVAGRLKDADWPQPLRAYSRFGAWSQFPLKRIDAVKGEGRGFRYYLGSGHVFTTDQR